MKKSILIILFIIILTFIYLLILNLPILFITTPDTNILNSQTTDIYISDNDTILVKQTVDVKDCIPENQSLYKIRNSIFYCPICSISDVGKSLSLSAIGKYQTNISILDEEKNSYFRKYYYNRNKTPENHLPSLINELKKNNYQVTFSYTINSKDVLSYIDNNTHILLNLKAKNKFKSINDLYIHLPDNVQILNTNSYIKKQNENTYKINLKKETANYSIKLDRIFTKFVSDSPKYVYKSYSQKKTILLKYSLYCCIPLTISLLIILILAYIQKKIKIDKSEYERNLEGIIEPILAESIIDGKIDAKNLIMTCLVNLIQKKNLENSENNYLTLVNTENLSNIEERVLLVLFSSQNNKDFIYNQKYRSFTIENVFESERKIDKYIGCSINLSNIKNTFMNNNKETLNIYDEFVNIKNMIQSQLYKQDLLSLKWATVLKHLRIFSSMLIFNILIILSNGINIFIPSNTFKPHLLYWILGNVIFYFTAKNLTFSKIIKSKLPKKPIFFSLYFCVPFFISVFEIIYNFYLVPIELLLAYFILFLINLLIYKFSNTYILTSKGKKEYKKVAMLKKYLLDYSLIEQRDMDSVIVFDDYLVYATAFGIPNKITSKLNENLMNLNIKLQVLSNILTL